MSRQRRTVDAQFSQAMRRRLNSYAVAASAAGVGMLALALPAEGEIIYTPTHKVIPSGTRYKLDLNHDGIRDFLLKNAAHCYSDGCFSYLEAKPNSGNGVQGFVYWASALKSGAWIGPSKYFPGEWMVTIATLAGSNTQISGSWVNVKRRYLGLRFKIDGKNHYGWARLNVEVQGFNITATLTGYAYETVPRKAIPAGDEGAGPTPEAARDESAMKLGLDRLQPASLGQLAIGAPGLGAWRRKAVATGR